MGFDIVFVVCALFVGQGCSENDKRILLSDPSYVQTQMEHMQSEIQDLIVKLSAQETTINSYKSSMTSLETIIQDQKSKVNAQQAEITSQQTTIHNLSTKINDLGVNANAQQTTISNLEKAISTVASTGKGVHFVRWGRKDCPGNYSLVYSGYAGGSYYTHTGAASEYVCMPPDPIWGPNKDMPMPYQGYIYGAEYEDGSLFNMPNWKEDVPCAVCESSSFTSVMMIPGRTQCYPGWTEAYHGDLASGRYNAPSSTQYVCVDQHPQALAGGGTTDDDGKLFYGVKSKCIPLKCPPYEDGKLLSCVVCLK